MAPGGLQGHQRIGVGRRHVDRGGAGGVEDGLGRVGVVRGWRARRWPRRGRAGPVLEQRPDVRRELLALAGAGDRGRRGADRGPRGWRGSGCQLARSEAPPGSRGLWATVSSPSLSLRASRNAPRAAAEHLVEPAALSVLRRGQPAVEPGSGVAHRLGEGRGPASGDEPGAAERMRRPPSGTWACARASTGGTSWPSVAAPKRAQPRLEVAQGIDGRTGPGRALLGQLHQGPHRLGGHPPVVVAEERAQRAHVLRHHHLGQPLGGDGAHLGGRRRSGPGAAPAGPRAASSAPARRRLPTGWARGRRRPAPPAAAWARAGTGPWPAPRRPAPPPIGWPRRTGRVVVSPGVVGGRPPSVRAASARGSSRETSRSSVASVRTRPSASSSARWAAGSVSFSSARSKRLGELGPDVVGHRLPGETQLAGGEGRHRPHRGHRVGQRLGDLRRGREVLHPGQRQQRPGADRRVGVEAGPRGERPVLRVACVLQLGDARLLDGGEVLSGGPWRRAADGQARHRDAGRGTHGGPLYRADPGLTMRFRVSEVTRSHPSSASTARR